MEKTEIELVYEGMKKVLYKKYEKFLDKVVLVGEPEVKAKFTAAQMEAHDFPEPFVTIDNSKIMLKYWKEEDLNGLGD